MWINQNWVDKLGMKMPTTTEEFYQLCKAFKEKNPKGIAITGCINSWHSDLETFFMNSFLYVPNMAPGTGEISHVVKDGKIDTPVNKPEYKEALAYLNKLYKEGLIYEGSFTQNVDQLKQLVTSEGEPVLCMAEGAHMNYINIAEYPELYRHYTSLAPLEGPKGARYTPNFKYNDYLQMGFTITKDCKNPEAAIRWADALYNMEVQFTEQFGPKGVAWEDPKPGDIGVNGKPALYRSIVQQTSSDTQNTCWPMTGIVYKPKEWVQGGATDPNVDVYSADGLTKFLVEETRMKYEPYAPKDIDIAPVLKLLPEESQEIQTLTVELTNYIEESMVRFIVGDLNTDKDWDKYVKGLNDMGLEKELAIKQKAYDRQFKK
jgi:putative aldouronate transport system substrate-binding protein